MPLARICSRSCLTMTLRQEGTLHHTATWGHAHRSLIARNAHLTVQTLRQEGTLHHTTTWGHAHRSLMMTNAHLTAHFFLLSIARKLRKGFDFSTANWGTRGKRRADMVWYGMVWCGVVWYGMVWCGVVWCGMVGMAWCLPAYAVL